MFNAAGEGFTEHDEVADSEVLGDASVFRSLARRRRAIGACRDIELYGAQLEVRRRYARDCA